MNTYILSRRIGRCSRCGFEGLIRVYGRRRLFCVVCEPANRFRTSYADLPERARTFDAREAKSTG